MVRIRYVQEYDKEFWYRFDTHLPEEEFGNKLREHSGYVLSEKERKGLYVYLAE